MRTRSITNVFITAICFVALCFCSCRDDEQYELPNENRFTKVNLVSGLDEPMELCVLPNGNILFIERKGAIKMFLSSDQEAIQIGKLDVAYELEDGLLGLAIDPDYEKNSFIYLFYSPVQKSVQRISRFILNGSTFNAASERVLLEIPTQRKECCHSAGSLAFGPDKTLYIAVGDNTNPHNPGYYNSIDERKGREYWDAQRTAGNTNDLRGKILRIKPEADGTYSIPEGNLFPKDVKDARPEIYAMGCRNPYRITVDEKTGYLYWGDVGQNTEDNPARGPISYDEFHQAKGPGFFGWPYFAGDNQPYADFDFATEKVGPFFDPLHPRNESPNNTGLRDLPPATGALIWYSYDSSKVFQALGTGGKSPIIGPVYHRDANKQPSWVKEPREFPGYYSGKLFIAEWMRDWINVVTLDAEGNLTKIERFMPSTKFDHPIDLEFGPDGALYVLEYGTFWFAQNKNARLARIDFTEGNRKPVARIEADKIAGAHPLTVTFSADSSVDLDEGDSLRYRWTFGKSPTTINGSTIKYTFNKPGVYTVNMRASDNQGAASDDKITISVGNDLPVIDLETSGNKSFYWPGKPIQYRVMVRDKEDGSTEQGTINPSDIKVVLSYTQYRTGINQNNEPVKFIGGLELINQSDCRSCHHEDTLSVGPSYKAIAMRYKGKGAVRDSLVNKIIHGGSGNWGETAMSAHPQLQREEAIEMVNYILSLAGETRNKVKSSAAFTPSKDATGEYLIEATYRDKGGVGIGPQQVTKTFRFRNPLIKAVDCDEYENVSLFNHEIAKFASTGAYIEFKDLDLSGISRMVINCFTTMPAKLEVRLDSAGGKLVGTAAIEPNASTRDVDSSKKTIGVDTRPIELQAVDGVHDVYFVYKDVGKNEASIFNSFDLFYVKVIP
jgi:cytochrome c